MKKVTFCSAQISGFNRNKDSKRASCANRKYLEKLCLSGLVLMSLLNMTQAFASEQKTLLNMQTAVWLAQQNDPWLEGNRLNQRATAAQSIAAATLPDPKMSIALANLPTDSFKFNQEPMTQMIVGVSQQFPQGQSLALKQKQLQQMEKQFPYLATDRKAKVTMSVSQLWLQVVKARQSVALIEKNRSLFEQLTDIAQASYSSAVGKTRQQDIVRAQLELTRLDDRLTQLKQHEELHWQKLREWLSDDFIDQYAAAKASAPAVENRHFENSRMDNQLPDIQLINPRILADNWRVENAADMQTLMNHPATLAIDQMIQAKAVDIDLAKQKYRPNWGLSASYGHRENDPVGNSRADFFSIGVTFDIPIFTGNRQDQQVAAAVDQTAASKTQKWQLLRNMFAAIESNRSQLLRLNQRWELYQHQLLPQMHQQADAALTAYTNDEGDFAEVVRARIAELNAQIDSIDIEVQRQQAIIQLNYYFVTDQVDLMVAGHTDLSKSNSRPILAESDAGEKQ